MSWNLAFIMAPQDLWLAVAGIAAWLVFVCLRAIGDELDHAVRCHNLKVEAHALRLRQMQRLQALGVKVKK